MSKVVVGVLAVTVFCVGLARRSGRSGGPGTRPVALTSEGYDLGV